MNYTFKGWTFITPDKKGDILHILESDDKVIGVLSTRKEARKIKGYTEILSDSKIVKVKVTLETI